jgi:hypothetical protein
MAATLTPAESPLTDEENAIALKEGWALIPCERFSNSDHFWSIQKEDDADIFKDDLEAWAYLCNNPKNPLYAKVIKFIQYNSNDHFDDLNMAFVKMPSKNDLPKKCKSSDCENKPPENMELRGILPDYHTNCRWFDCKDTKWSMSLNLKRDFYYPELDKLPSTGAVVKIAEFRCPQCNERHNKFMNDILKEI